ncbi:uncharacterized protein LY79DRAFT_580311 [Colletotrichum navitas]|uniref:Uncharacterized protein n=1 Tax=Colletotrichum navitas TaxID=681940 RepID=A0AAD8PYI3_9PEZI|nr:uncharacterized protein LY79DRAFT_580311 [Colletotrichum navitas]KAK1589883.1 hypothetical protein LY79DRAFT_580311 [Colletotrichum navitas]
MKEMKYLYGGAKAKQLFLPSRAILEQALKIPILFDDWRKVCMPTESAPSRPSLTWCSSEASRIVESVMGGGPQRPANKPFPATGSPTPFIVPAVFSHRPTAVGGLPSDINAHCARHPRRTKAGVHRGGCRLSTSRICPASAGYEYRAVLDIPLLTARLTSLASYFI